ncbi:queuine tRNA-ribosyltransferase [Rhodopirellula rubra]|uniref:Queuine tRNA-ribosyltransferase n=1 Tax=Aporhodopirellula rubra TaxID=980271 RepID=A0A7W5H6I1_9BACT|nr:tRNA guanosine(34) transglycosylase Tgt [Aporhodopirellula rubra]MBB3207353.1 queuine tRNA-ribosyltransferase [Aporhodopirellula rubra]
MFRFDLQHECDGARRGVFHTPRGDVQTPGFMPVGTVGTVKGLTIDQVAATGADMILGNTYHLRLRPGHETVARLGGLHKMCGWDGPILTDSGGFQVFSLGALNRVTEHAATFRSHLDGAKIELTPEHSIEIQQALGSDVAMVLDHVIALPASATEVEDALARSIRWAKRCRDVADRPEQALFAIVQGGLDPVLRRQCATELASMPFEGYAVGGLSVGETPEEMYATAAITTEYLPPEKPRYLMGVGTPRDLLENIARGIDLFDCVMPTRNGRNALAFTDEGPIKLRNAVHREDTRPVMEDCVCLACRHSRGYLRHLFNANEMLGPILLSHHNLMYYGRLMREARAAIEAGQFSEFATMKLRGWGFEPMSVSANGVH